MSHHGGDHRCGKSDHCCHHNATNPSVHQTLDEFDFTRGIWTSALTGDNDDVEHKLKQSNGSDVNKTDKSGYTALHYACRNGHLQVCKTLLAYHADVNIATQSSRATPLHRAAYMGHAEIVSLLLKHGALPLLCDCDGMTALHKAAENGHMETARILLNAEPKAAAIEDNKGRTPVDLAKSNELRAKLKS